MPQPRSTPSIPELAGRCVLVIDDDDDARAIITASLHHAGATMTSAAAGDHALDDLTQYLPDVIICDLRMPRVDGRGFLRALRARSLEQGGGIPVIAITAHAEALSPGEAAGLGFAAVLAKPIDLERLGRVVAAVCCGGGQATR